MRDLEEKRGKEDCSLSSDFHICKAVCKHTKYTAFVIRLYTAKHTQYINWGEAAGGTRRHLGAADPDNSSLAGPQVIHPILHQPLSTTRA